MENMKMSGESGSDAASAGMAIIRIQAEIEDVQRQKNNLSYHLSKSLLFLNLLKYILILSGSIFTIIGILEFKTKTGFILLLFGIAMFILLYFIWTAFRRRELESRARWQESSATTIQSLDYEIAQKTKDLKSFQDLV